MAEKVSYPLVRTVKGRFKQEDGNLIKTVVHIDPTVSRLKFPQETAQGCVNGYLKKFTVFADVPNLPMATIPTMEITASASEVYAAQKQVEWHSPGFGILLWVSKLANPSSDPSAGDWDAVGYHSVINVGSWRQYDSFPVFSNNLTEDLEEGDKIGISLQSRWVDGVEYFAKYNPPFSLPDNRADRITYQLSWVQDLVVAKPDAKPIFLTVFSTSSSGQTQTQTQPPTVALNDNNGQALATTLYTYDKTPITVNIGNLQANSQFSYQWYLAGNPIGTIATDTASSTGTKSYSFDSSAFLSAPFSGTGAYSLRVTQGSFSTDSNAITIKHFTCSVSQPPLVYYSGSTWVAQIFDFKDSTQITLTMQKNGVDLAGWSYPAIPTYQSGATPPYWRIGSIPLSIFTQSGWGVGTGETYNLKATYNGVSCISTGFLVNNPSGGGGLG